MVAGAPEVRRRLEVGATLGPVVDPGRVETIARLAAGQGAGEPTAVLPVRTPAGVELFVCAFADLTGTLRWVVLDAGGDPVRDRHAVVDAVELAAICETAEEAAAALVADEVLPLLAEGRALAERLGEDDAARAARVTAEALGELGEREDGERVAEAAYLDRMAMLAQALGDRLDLLQEAAGGVTMRLAEPGHPLEPLARTLWDAVRLIARDGSPERFAATLEGAMPAARALADDVQASYLVPFDEPDGDGAAGPSPQA